jgi:post-segregation antitoxin (ccd killing protein)
MVETTTISAKISKEMRQKLERFHVPISKVIRAALEDEIRKKEEEQVAGNLERARTILKKVPKGQTAEIIRADRDER